MVVRGVNEESAGGSSRRWIVVLVIVVCCFVSVTVFRFVRSGRDGKRRNVE